MSDITGILAQEMVSDWLATPVNGYLGSSYGQDIKRILHTPMASVAADAQIAKLRADVPVIGLLPGDAVNIYAESRGIDEKHLFVEIAGRVLEIR